MPKTMEEMEEWVKSLLGKRKNEDDDDDPEEPRGERALKAELSRIRQLRREEKTALEAMRTEIEGIKTSTAKTIADREKAHKEELAARETSHARNLSLARAGVTDDRHARAVLVAWGEQDEKTRPATPGEYWESVKATAAKKDGLASIPRDLHGYIPAPETKKKEPPNTSAGTGGTPPDSKARLSGAKSMAELLSIAGELDAANESG